MFNLDDGAILRRIFSQRRQLDAEVELVSVDRLSFVYNNARETNARVACERCRNCCSSMNASTRRSSSASMMKVVGQSPGFRALGFIA